MFQTLDSAAGRHFLAQLREIVAMRDMTSRQLKAAALRHLADELDPPLPAPDGPLVAVFEVGPEQNWRAVLFESPAALEQQWREHEEELRTAVQPYVPAAGRFYAGEGYPEGVVPLVSLDEVLAEARRVRVETWGEGS